MPGQRTTRGLLPARLGWIATVLLLGELAGCSPGINWRAYAWDPGAADTARKGKVAFVYFRHWAVVQCTEFEEKVLKDPAILTATAELYCVVLDYRVDKRLADEWGISEPPGGAFLDPGGRVLDRFSGSLSVEALRDRIASARRSAASPAASSPVRP